MIRSIAIFKKLHEAEIDAISACREQIAAVNAQIISGIIDEVDAAEELSMISRKEFKLKKKLVMEVHTTKDGQPRKIEYQESKGLYHTMLPGKKKIYGKTEEIIIDKLFDAYGLIIKDLSVRSVFDEALIDQSITLNNNESTINNYRSAFTRYIADELAAMDIRDVTVKKLQAYTQKMVNDMHPTKKAFFKYKGILNITFRYAHYTGYISKNPVESINNRCYYKSCTPAAHSPEEKILTETEIQELRNTIRRYMGLKRYNGYFINGYAILFAIETGVRAGEIPALKWTDIKEDHIHIHAQQLYNVRKGGKHYYYADWTKDEKEGSRGGREFPLTDELKSLLSELKALQEQLGITSEYIFVHEDGEWIKTDAYETCLRRMMLSLGFTVTNNHSLRMSLNSNVFIPLGIPVTERARMLGHSVQTNLNYYSFAGKDKNNDICALLNKSQRYSVC